MSDMSYLIALCVWRGRSEKRIAYFFFSTDIAVSEFYTQKYICTRQFSVGGCKRSVYVKHLTHAAQNQGYESHVKFFISYQPYPPITSHFPLFTSYVNSLEMDLLFSHFHCC